MIPGTHAHMLFGDHLPELVGKILKEATDDGTITAYQGAENQIQGIWRLVARVGGGTTTSMILLNIMADLRSRRTILGRVVLKREKK